MALISDVRFRLLAAAALAVATLITYGNTFGGDFLWDDASSVQLHQDVKNFRVGEIFSKDQHAYGKGQGNFYRPLVSLSFAVDYALTTWGREPEQTGFGVPDISPFLFHVSNVLWHAAAGILLLLLLAQFGAPRIVQACVPMLYVVHPLHTEAVAYISGRADPMAAAFGFAGLLFALKSASGNRRILGVVLSAVCFALALLCKESALIFPAVLVAFVLAIRLGGPKGEEEERPSTPALALIVSAAIVGVYLALRATVLNFGDDSGGRNAGIGQRIVECLQAFALYIKLIFIPTGLHMERTLDGVPSWVAGAGAVLLVACVAAAVWAFLSKQPRLWAAIALFLVTWLPISGLFPLNAPMAEHWMYVPLAGFLWALFEVACLAAKSVRARAALVALAYVAGLCLIALTVTRNKDWQNNETLYLATLAENPESIRVAYNLAVTYEDLLDNLPGARRNYERVIALRQEKKAASGESTTYWDDELEAHLSLGRILMSERRYDAAASHFATLLQVTPTGSNRPLIQSAVLGMVDTLLAMQQFDTVNQFIDQSKTRYPDIAGELDRRQRSLPAVQPAAPRAG